jgi:hypothetical protein
MDIPVAFTLNIDPAEWCRESGTVTAMETLPADVAHHAENVVRDLFWDQGWTKAR